MKEINLIIRNQNNKLSQLNKLLLSWFDERKYVVITNLENIFLQQANLLFGYLHAMLVHKLTKTDILPENLKEDPICHYLSTEFKWPQIFPG